MAACVLWSVRAALSATVILASLVHRTAAQTAAEAPEQTPGQPMVQSPAPGETGGEMVLTRDALLASARARYPEILARLADQAAAAGRADAAQGAFDLFLESEAEGWLTGFYQGTSVANVGVKRRFRDRGGSIYGGYRLAEGLFPVYDDVNFTNNLGELKVGAVFALMRDRAIDSDRFAVSDLALAEKQAAIEILLTEVGIQRAALVGYWNWIASGEVVDVFRSLLKRAEDRQDALTRQFEQGAVAEIMLLENQRVVTNRQAQLARARQDFAIASNDLSLFWRDAAGGTLVPKPSQRPVSQPLSADHFSLAIDTLDMASIGRERFDLQLLALGVERAQNRISLAENNLRPQLDLNVELSRDFGAIAEGGASRDSTDFVAGVEFSVPLERTRARGVQSAARAELRAQQIRRRLATEEVELELRNVLARLSASYRLYLLAQDEVDLSRQMTEAEQQLFENGASDLFRIIFREEDEGRAQIDYISARRQTLIARTDFDAATVNLEALGLARPR